MYFSVRKLNIGKWLLVNLKINRLPDLHIVDRYLATTRLFSVENDGKGLDYFVPEKEKVMPGDLPEAYHNGYIVLVIGAKHVTKKLPAEKLKLLIEELRDPVILVGGPEDKEDGEALIQSLPDRQILNGCGKWSINQSASVISQSKGVVTHDTGMMHIAAAFKKKIITIWGNTIPQFGMYAYQPDPASVDFEVSGLPCRPCSKLGKTACPKKHFKCMMEQDTAGIAETANRIF